jgi:hypothetical protein
VYCGVHKTRNALTKIVTAKLPMNEIEKNWKKLVRSGKNSRDEENATKQDHFRSFLYKLQLFENRGSKQRVTKIRIRISYGHKTFDSLDGALRTSALIKILKNHNA